MRTRLVTVLVFVLALTVALAAAGFAAPPRNFVAPLSGDQEVPAVDTDGTGVAKFQLRGDGEALDFRVNVANIDDVTMAHIHLAPRGENGAVVAWLYPDAPPPQLIEGRTNGPLATGTVTDDDLVGPLAGADLDTLVDAIEAGEAYVNVHTSEFGRGEIRGQIDVPRGRGGPN